MTKQIIPEKNLVFIDEDRPITVDCRALDPKIAFVGMEGDQKWVEFKPFTGRVTDYDFTLIDALFAAAEELIRQDPPTLADVRHEKAQAVDAERAVRAVSPITYSDAPFDTDTTARERISGLILRLLRGDGLPAGWMVWRDADNAMHWSSLPAADVLAQLSGLSRAIEDREQALLIAAWQHKAALQVLPDADSVAAYDITSGWPG